MAQIVITDKRKVMPMPSHDNDNNEPRLISMRDACTLTSLSRTMLNRYRDSGRFPAAVPLGERRFAFVRAEVVDWVNGRIAARHNRRAA